MVWSTWRSCEVVIVRPSKKYIKQILAETERTFNLRKEVLQEIYDAEAQVVFMGRRRGITDKLRKIIKDAAKDEEREVD